MEIKKTKRQIITVYKAQHSNLIAEQHEPHKELG